MLNRDRLIETLAEIEGKGKTHGEMFEIRKTLRGLGLVALGERYQAATKSDKEPGGKDPHALERAA